MEFREVKGTEAEGSIKELRNIFAVFRMPKEVVSDNGPPFNGEQYRRFLASKRVNKLWIKGKITKSVSFKFKSGMKFGMCMLKI